MTKDSFLTERQLEILRFRKKGLSQTEIARALGTTRANISATEKTALNNVKKAENTLKLWKMLDAHIWIQIDKDTDLNDVPRIVYQRAGEENIWVNLDTPTLIGEIQRSCQNKIKGRRVIRDIDITITKDGDITAR